MLHNNKDLQAWMLLDKGRHLIIQANIYKLCYIFIYVYMCVCVHKNT